MKWTKLGKIFNPEDYGEFFAQSPQVIDLGNSLRVYYSTRTKDKDKYLSNISYVDFNYNFTEIINKSYHTIIPLGSLGCFDEHGIFPMNVIKYNDLIYGYTSGWNRKASVSVDTSIGLAISQDNGETFKKIGEGPILTSSPFEPFLVGDPFVKFINYKFHMWYIYGTTWTIFEGNNSPDRVYKIGHATSDDGINWTKENRQLITDCYEDESQALPTVFYYNNKYHMIFCFRQSSDFRTNKDRSYRLGYAYSNDLINWVRNDKLLEFEHSINEWDSDMMCYPHVFQKEDNIYLLYNGNEFGKHGFGLAKLEVENEKL